MFGIYFQTVMHELTIKYGWDDAYSAITPLYDKDGVIIEMIYQGYIDKRPAWVIAQEIDTKRFGEEKLP